jgi:hypothetical protein
MDSGGEAGVFNISPGSVTPAFSASKANRGWLPDPELLVSSGRGAASLVNETPLSWSLIPAALLLGNEAKYVSCFCRVLYFIMMKVFIRNGWFRVPLFFLNHCQHDTLSTDQKTLIHNKFRWQQAIDWKGWSHKLKGTAVGRRNI